MLTREEERDLILDKAGELVELCDSLNATIVLSIGDIEDRTGFNIKYSGPANELGRAIIQSLLDVGRAVEPLVQTLSYSEELAYTLNLALSTINYEEKRTIFEDLTVEPLPYEEESK